MKQNTDINDTFVFWKQLNSLLIKSTSNINANVNLVAAAWKDYFKMFGFNLPNNHHDDLDFFNIETIYSTNDNGDLRSAKLFTPKNSQPQALLVMLHGCMQDADSFNKLTKITQTAQENNLAVLIADQQTYANTMQCWNWHLPENQSKNSGEPLLLAKLIKQAQRVCSISPNKTHISGISAGGALTALMTQLYPELINSAVIVAAPAPFSASSLKEALSVMTNGPELDSKNHQTNTNTIDYSNAPKACPIMIIQGKSDDIVNQKNLTLQENAAIFLNDKLDDGLINESITKTIDYQHNNDNFSVFKNKHNQIVCIIVNPKNLTHAWSGGDINEPFAQEGFNMTEILNHFFKFSRNNELNDKNVSKIKKSLTF